MTKIKIRISLLGTGIVILSLLLFFFALPHTLEDFATGQPAKAGVPMIALAYVVAGIFALQGLGLFWVGRQMRRGYVIHAILGLFWPIAAGIAETIPAKMIREIPLPTPLCVICSPIHINSIVPASMEIAATITKVL